MTTTTPPAAPQRAPGMTTRVLSGPGGMTGTLTLLRLALRRDRILIPVVVLGLAALAISSAQATLALYPTPENVTANLGGVLSNPALLAMYGPITNPTSPDAFAIYKTVMMGGIFLSLAAYAIVRRHTRTEEEEGRLELVSAGVVGRRAPLTAAMLLALGTVLLTCAVAVAGMLSLGMDPVGTLAFGAAWFGIGLVMTAVTAVAAQLTVTARGCAAIAIGVLGASFLIRAVADSVDGAERLSWLSYLGWAQKVQPYGGNRFSAVLVSVAASVVLLVVAYRLLERRDLGAGMIATRPGPDRAGRWLSSPLGLAWRLQRWSLLGWTLGFVLVGALLGSIAGSVEQMLSDPAMADLLRQIGGGEGTLTDLFLTAEFSFAGLITAAYGITATLRLRGEERDIRAEPVLATSTSRWSLLGSHLVIALAGTAWLLLVLGTSVGVIRGIAVGDLGGELAKLTEAALAPLPAVWVCVGLTVLVFGLAPRLTSVAWAALVAFLVIGEFGELLGLPAWLQDLSPFAHLPALPGGVLTLAPLLALTAGAIFLLASGSISFRRRDVG